LLCFVCNEASASQRLALASGDFTQNTGGGWNTSAGLDFTASNLTYDANGNILTMNQKGWKLGKPSANYTLLANKKYLSQ